MRAAVWFSPPRPGSAVWPTASSQCLHSVSKLARLMLHRYRHEIKSKDLWTGLQCVLTFLSSSAWLDTSSVCFSFSLLYLCSVACARSAQRGEMIKYTVCLNFLVPQTETVDFVSLSASMKVDWRLSCSAFRRRVASSSMRSCSFSTRARCFCARCSSSSASRLLIWDFSWVMYRWAFRKRREVYI